MSLNKTQLVSAVAADTGLSKVDAEKALKSTIEAIKKELADGGSVTLIGFGTFSVIKRAARIGKNPQTGETIQIPEKLVAKFKPGKELSDAVFPKTEPKKKAKKKGKKK
jgi:DNA-binding protein HU-beta